MADEQFYTILTNIGKAKVANAALLSSNVTLKMLKVGDGNGTYYNPTEDQKELKNTVYTCNVGSVTVDTKNPNWIIAETIIPGSVGGFTIREVGLFDVDGDMIAIGKYPETYKPVVANGASKDLNVRTIFEVSNAQSVTLNLDPSVIIATKEDIENLQKQITSNDEDIAVLSNPNILINGCFINAINQRGYSTYEPDLATVTYTIDRWSIANSNYFDGKVDVETENIILTKGTNSDVGCQLVQIMHDATYKCYALLNSKFTFTVKAKGQNGNKVKLVCFAGTTILGVKEFDITEDYQNYSLTFSLFEVEDYNYSRNNGFRVAIMNKTDNSSIYIQQAKLELGDKFTGYVYEGIFEEWRKCTTYFINPATRSYAQVGNGNAESTTSAKVWIPSLDYMRVYNPTVAKCENLYILRYNTGTSVPCTATGCRRDGGILSLSISITDTSVALTKGEPVALVAKELRPNLWLDEEIY